MLCSSEEFASFFGFEHAPPLNERTITFIESFLAFSLDSDFQKYSSSLILFFNQHFSQIFQMRQENLDPNDDALYSRLILSLSYLRTPYIPLDFFLSAEECASYCLKNFTGQILQASFSFLCTHYCNQRKNPEEGLFSFIEWIHQYFISCARNVNMIDIKFYVVVTFSMKPLLMRVLDFILIKHPNLQQPPQPPPNPQLNPQQQQQQKQKYSQALQEIRQQKMSLLVEKIPDFLTPVSDIVREGLVNCSPQFFSIHNEIIIVKALRLIVKFLEISVRPSPTVVETLWNIGRLIPDDSRYFHIFENYLIVSFYISELDKEQTSNFSKYSFSKSLSILQYASQYPISTNKRIQIYLQSLEFLSSKISKKSVENFNAVMESLWPLLGSSKIHVFSHRIVTKVLYYMTSTDLLKNNSMLMTTILREVASGLELLRLEFDTSQQDLEIELSNWIDVNNHLVKLASTLLSMEATSKDENDRARMINPTLRMPIYRKITKHMIFAMNVIVIAPEIKEKVVEMINAFAQFISTLSSIPSNYFSENMIDLLPRTYQQTFHINLHQYLINKIQKPIYYFVCFFETINNHFDELFMPAPTLNLLEITRLIFKKAFLDEIPPMQPNQPNYYLKMCSDLYKFFLKGVLSRNYDTMRLLTYIIQSSNKSIQRLQRFQQHLKQSTFSLPKIIRYLSEDPRIEINASSLAIFLYPLCDINKSTPEEWYSLFIPAIESDQNPSYSIIPFYSFTAPKFAEQIPSFPIPLQYKIITSLALSSSKLKNNDKNPSLTLLSRIPTIASELSRSTSISKNQYAFVNIDGIEIDLDIVKEMLRETSPQKNAYNADNLCEIFEAIVLQIGFQSATSSEAIDKIAEIICRDRIDFLRSKSAQFLSQLSAIESSIDDINDFNKRLTLLKALQIIFYYRVKYISVSENNYIKPNNTIESDNKDLYETEEEKEKRYEDEIFQIFVELNDNNKITFFESFFILVYSKLTSIFALRAIEIMARNTEKSNFDFSPIVHELNSIVLNGAQHDYQTSKRIMTESIFPLLRRYLVNNENNPNQITQENRLNIYRQYFQSSTQLYYNVSKLAMKGMRFIESLSLTPNEISENRKKSISKLPQYISNNQYYLFNFIFYKPFDDLPENPQLLNDLISILKTQNPTIVKEAVKLINSNPINEPNIVSYFKTKFILKTIAFYLASLPPSLCTQDIWTQILKILRDHANKQFYDFFLKQLTKFKPNPSMPFDCVRIASDISDQLNKLKQQLLQSNQSSAQQQNQSQQQQQQQTLIFSLMNVPYDLDLLKLIIMNTDPKIIERIASSCLKSATELIHQSMSSPQTEQIGTKVFEILSYCTHVDFDSKFVNYTFIATITLMKRTNPVHLPLGLIAERYTYQLATIFCEYFAKQWSYTIFCIFADLVSDVRNVKFRDFIIEKLKTNTKLIIEYMKKQENTIDIDCVASIFLSSAEKITNNPNCTLKMYRDVLEIVISLVELLPKDQHNHLFTIYKPSIFIPMIGMFFPNLNQIAENGNDESPQKNIKGSNSSGPSAPSPSGVSSIFQQMIQKRKQINIKLKKNNIKEVNQNLRDVNTMTGLLIPFFLNQPLLFLQRLFVKRFTDFVKLMYTTFEERNIIYDYVERMARNPDQIYSQLLCWQLISSRFKYFPEDARLLYPEDKPFHVGFSEFPPSPMIQSYLLHFAATTISSRKKASDNSENDEFIFTDDLKDNKAILVESSMASIAAYHNIYPLDQCCNTVSRFFHIARFLQKANMKFDSDSYLNRLFELLSNSPNCSKPANTAFRSFATYDISSDDRFKMFSLLFSWANLYSAGQLAEKNFLYMMPVVLKKIKAPPIARERAFEQLIYCTMNLLEKQNENFHQYVYLPGAFEEILPELSVSRVYESCKKMIDRIKKKISEIPCQKMNPLLRYLPSIFASMSKLLLYNDRLYCPPALLPNVVLELTGYKDFKPSYQKAMISCISVSGHEYSEFLIQELYKVLKKSFEKINPPLKTPFATICMWINEVIENKEFSNFVPIYLEIFKPTEEYKIVQEFLNMKQPLHFIVEDYIIKNIPLNDKLKEFALFCPKTRPIYIKNAVQLRIEEEGIGNYDELSEEDKKRFRLNALHTACWKTQWNEINDKVRPYFFGKLIFPKCMTPFVKFFSIKQITELINIALVSIIDYKPMERFAEYYCSLYPTSILSECFSTVYKLFDNKTPLPLQTPYQAMKFLENLNFYDDSLGILKINHPEYLAAATFHQLSNFSAAKAHYLNTMSENEDSYFFGLNFLRSCEINLSLTRAQIPFEKISSDEIVLPFLQTYTSPNAFTSFYSPVFLPLLLLYAIRGEVHVARSNLQQRQSSLNSELLKQYSSIVLKCLDKQTANVSNFVWKLSFLNYYQTLNDPSIQSNIADVIRRNRNYISCLLMKTGDTKGALKMFDIFLGHSAGNSSSGNSSLPADSLTSQQLQQQNLLRQQASLNLINGMNIAAAAAAASATVNSGANINLGFNDPLMKTFKITSENLPRIVHFASKKQFLTLPRLLQFRLLSKLRYPIILESLFNPGNISNSPSQSTVSSQASAASNSFNAAVAALTQQQSHSNLAGRHHGPSASQLTAASGGHANSQTSFAQILVAAAAASANSNGGAGAGGPNQTVAAALSRAMSNSNSSNSNSSLSSINNQFNQLNSNIAYVLKYSSRLWVDTLVSILSTSSISIDEKQVFARIQKELVKSKGERANFLIALSIGLVRLEEVYKTAFVSTMLVKDISDELKSYWIKWLQLLMAYVKEPPHEFLYELYKFHPIWFYMVTMPRTTEEKTPFIVDFYKRIEKSSKERKQRVEYEMGFSCLRKFEQEFKTYFKNYQIRYFLYKFLSSPNTYKIPKEILDQFDGSIEKMARYCDSCPVVFTTKQKIPDFRTSHGFKFPTVLNPIVAVSFHADGKSEACFKLTTVTGESRRFTVVSPFYYKFQARESLLMFGISKIFDKHPSLRTRSSFNFYPQSFPVHCFVLIATYPLVSLQKIAHDNHIALHLYKTYERVKTEEEGPAVQRERKRTDLPVDTFQKAYAKLAKGSLIDFLFARQSFASHLALSCALSFLFNFPVLSPIPAMVISGDGQRLVIPDFFSQVTSLSQIPITRGIKNALPDYLMHGSFTTTWMGIFDALQKNSDTFRIYLRVLYPDVPKAATKIDLTLRKLEKMSTHAQEENNVFNPPFPVLLVQNLIDCAVNDFEAQATGFSWI